MSRSPKFTFIVGYPRSGTTWAMWLLANHPRIVTCFHSGLFHALEPLHNWWIKEVPYGKQIHTLQPAEQMAAAGPDGFSRAVLSDLLDQDQFRQQLAPLVEHVFNTIARCADNPAVVVEKTPENLLFLSWALELLPQAHVLHIVRDPRSAWLSIRKSRSFLNFSPNVDSSAVKSARHWVQYMEEGRRIAARTERYKAVRYEDLQQDGVQQLGDIYAWLGLKSDPRMCEQVLEKAGIEKMRQNWLAPREFFRKGASAEWKTELPARDVRAIEFITANWLARLDYPVVYGEQKSAPLQVWIDRRLKTFVEILKAIRRKVRRER